ncbi:hypothetical protein GMB86_08165 [Terrilactibacillus sp. BCM23-1]|uniref:Uncharacterized protein n=1 Tax=Terrilactibacillus tamarindi TaxID=2599694 RepID=A0A6N8CP89_9BACI|nr:hypothetical protein [Terrilactibacillus tamarindi]MTT31984.1 hypothetical protein [Terrilactibacillus tamarindi]
MKQVIQTLKRNDAEKRIPVVKLEIDYELATLHHAILTKNDKEITRCKARLEKLRQEMIQLEA